MNDSNSTSINVRYCKFGKIGFGTVLWLECGRCGFSPWQGSWRLYPWTSIYTVDTSLSLVGNKMGMQTPIVEVNPL